MKRITAIALTLLLTLMPILAMTGCAAEKTPVELFTLGCDKLEEFFSQGTLAGADSFAEANKLALSLRDASIGYMGEESEALPEVNLTAVSADDKSYIDLNMTVDDQAVGLVGAYSAGKLLLAAPEITDYYLTGTLEDIAELAGLDSETMDSFSAMLSASDSMTTALTELEAKLMTEEYIKSEEVDLTIGDTEYTALQKVTLSVPESEIAAIKDQLLGELDLSSLMTEDLGITEEDLDFTASADISFYFKKEELLRAEAKVLVNSQYTLNLTADLSTSEDGANEADIAITVSDGEEEIAAVPMTYTCKTADGQIDGNVSLKMNIDSLASYIYSEDIELYDVSVGDIEVTIEFTGALTDISSDIDYKASVSVQGVTISIPYNIKNEITDNTMTSSFTIDTNIMGATIDAKLALTVEKNASAEQLVTDLSEEDEISLKSLSEDDEDTWLRLEALGEDLDTFIEENDKLAEFIESLDPEDDYGDYSDLLYSVYGDNVSFDFFADGSCDYYVSYDLAISDTGDIVLSTLDQEILTIKVSDDGTATIDGEVFDYCDYSDWDYPMLEFTSQSPDAGISSIWVYPEDAYADISFEATYAMDDSNIYITYSDGDVMSMEYVIDEDAEIIYIDGMEFYYVDYTEDYVY